jgi:hypothetical protein
MTTPKKKSAASRKLTDLIKARKKLELDLKKVKKRVKAHVEEYDWDDIPYPDRH